MIAHVVAMSTNRVIGKDGDLPWRISADLKHFKKLTLHKTVIMGRKTFKSLPNGALPNRNNIVITRDTTFTAPGCTIAHSIDEALEIAKSSSKEDIMIIGGAEIYKQTLHLADTLYLTMVHREIEGDAIYPEWEPLFDAVESVPAAEGDYEFTFMTCKKR